MTVKPKFIFGPVPSRRLGRSLGIDVTPRKTCTFDCLYCECGRTTELTVDRSCFADPGLILNELREYFTSEASAPVDVITFSGSGEPTLYTHLNELIYGIKKLYPGIPVGVLTNGSLLWNDEVRRALILADFVVPSLDAPSPEIWRRINRPHPAISWDQYVKGLVAFRKDYSGSYVLEVFLLKGINDSPEILESFKRLIGKIKPDLVDLNTLARPGTASGVQGLDEEELVNAAATLRPFKCRVIGKYRKKNSAKPLTPFQIPDKVIAVVSRRPCTADELADSLAIPFDRLQGLLDELTTSGKVKKEKVAGRIFYSAPSE
ncbi:radical SAM protein [Thermodesulforhabdus norvegica]|uniref:Wyosine [tRNA(Phe)-imidazoG37] synthetase, radical SAM superfamily n=1 Tax=Thermodesulforhabdus norvegica TaxID=39841 RepID=A0A1I4UBP8_9BACT|nr:radical SAM protein [Thermodesulforhabdus norvegica]SFM86416.1 Wyosine [tRNA(Phe)-imidazoG37] synthetase, radical SAM superfamily [Thermodesulforhabdus norvegica]